MENNIYGIFVFYFKTGEDGRKICSVYKEASVNDCAKFYAELYLITREISWDLISNSDMRRIDIIWKVTSVLKISKSSTENLLQLGYVSLIDVWLPHCNHH